MSKGIYKIGNKYAYSMNLEKKLKKKKDAEIVEVCDESYTDALLQLKIYSYLQESTVEILEQEDIKKYYFYNPNTKETITSIYDNLDNITNDINWIKK